MIQKPLHTAVIAALACMASFATPALSQVRGGYETFTSQNNAESWGLYDFSDEGFYIPFWDFSQIENPEIYGFVLPGSGISLFADHLSSNASFVGDFNAKRISGLSCEAYVEDAASLYAADFYFFSAGVLYFSQEFLAPNHFSTDGWEYLEVSFKDDPWFTIDNDEIVQVDLTAEILSTITEVGVDFFASPEAPSDFIVAIDNFTLIPELIVPAVSITKNGGDIELGFQREPGQFYDILQSPNLSGWSILPGFDFITGEGLFTASEPLAGMKFFRIATDVLYTPIPDIGPPP